MGTLSLTLVESSTMSVRISRTTILGKGLLIRFVSQPLSRRLSYQAPTRCALISSLPASPLRPFRRAMSGDDHRTGGEKAHEEPDHSREHSQPDKAERHDRPPYIRSEGFKAVFRGECYCGTVKYEVASNPLDAMYCHCRDCQRLHGAPYQWAAVFHKKDVHFVEGAKDLLFYNFNLKKMAYLLPCKVSCRNCHSPLAGESLLNGPSNPR